MRTCRPVLLVLCAVASACGSSSGGRGELIETEQVAASVQLDDVKAAVTSAVAQIEAAQAVPGQNAEQLQQLGDAHGLFVYIRDVVLTWAQTAFAGRVHLADVQRVKYWSVDANGKAVRLSGAMFVPLHLGLSREKLPIVSVQHGTQIYRPFAPSLFTYDMKQLILDERIMDQAECVVALFMAMGGYTVVMPDYPSLGVSTDPHPYVHRSIANSVVDMIKASKAVLDAKANLLYPVWDERLYLTGYSEGGYATLATAHQLSLPGAPFAPTAVAPLDGPYDLSTTMRQGMVAPLPHPEAWFLPYMLYGIHDVYPGDQYAFATVFAPGYDTKLPPLLDGTHRAGEVMAAMPLRAGATEPVPSDVLAPGFLALVEKPYTGQPDTDGPVVTMLAANDAYRGWTPSMPLKFFHAKTDEIVPFGNASAAQAAFTAAKAPLLEAIGDVTPIDGMGSVHVGAALPAYLAGYQWIDAKAYP